ncbi:hypothetical protein TNCV_3291111 [Trichonephila clavipes]|nr:hypothetical protein TNCV_3291111 [Trichonephila clavipes]
MRCRREAKSDLWCLKVLNFMKLHLSPHIMTPLSENSEPIASSVRHGTKERVRSVSRGHHPKMKTFCLFYIRKALKREFMSSPSPDAAVNLINAKIKQLYSVSEDNVGIAFVKVLTHILLVLNSGNW